VNSDTQPLNSELMARPLCGGGEVDPSAPSQRSLKPAPPRATCPDRQGSPTSILEQITPFRPYGPTKAQEIAGKLEALIAESQLEAGALLATKEELRRRFQVSPATMNEAIRILESSGRA
jgi:hypothetical protein